MIDYQPLILGHRGAGWSREDTAHYVENTKTSFDLALEEGADGLEFDLRLTADGQLVTLHDVDLKRLTGDTRLVTEVTLAEIKTLVSGVMTSEEVLERYGQKSFLNIELKQAAFPLIPATLYERIIISCFNHNELRHLRRISPDIPLGALFENAHLKEEKLARGKDYLHYPDEIEAVLQDATLDVAAIHLWEGDITPERAKMVHDAGRKLVSYAQQEPLPQDNEAQIDVLIQAKTDIIITNHPKEMRRKIQK